MTNTANRIKMKKTRRKTKIKSKKIKLVKFVGWVLKPFDKNIRLGGLIKRWFLFLLAGFVVMGAIQFFARYDFSEADTLTSETGVGCDMLAMSLLLILPPIEETLFRILPYRYSGRKAAFVGSLVWAGLHLFGRNLAIVGFQAVMSIFYFKLVTAGRYRDAIISHEAFNILPLLTCFLV